MVQEGFAADTEGMERIEEVNARKAEASAHLSKGELDEAYAIYEQLASQGDTESQVFVGGRYATGIGREQDATRAIHWLQPAAEKGDPPGLYYLALAYELDGNMKDSILALEQACSAGFSPACVRLGTMYESGVGVATDIDRAFSYYKMAHRAGHLFGRRFYARCLMDGKKGGVFARLWGFALYGWTFLHGLVMALIRPDSDHFRL